MASPRRAKRGVSPRVVAIVAAALVILVGGNWAYAELNGSYDPQSAAEQPVSMDAPIEVTHLPSYSGDWTFERQGSSVTVKTNISMDDEGRRLAKNVCNLTLYEVDDAERVVVEGRNGVELC